MVMVAVFPVSGRYSHGDKTCNIVCKLIYRGSYQMSAKVTNCVTDPPDGVTSLNGHKESSDVFALKLMQLRNQDSDLAVIKA